MRSKHELLIVRAETCVILRVCLAREDEHSACRNYPFEDLLAVALTAVGTALTRVVLNRAPRLAGLPAFSGTSLSSQSRHLQLVVDLLCEGSIPDLNLPYGFCTALTQLLRLTDELLEDEVKAATLGEAAEAAHKVGEALENLGTGDLAYNLFECSYHIFNLIERPCLPTAAALRRLSDPDNIDQHHSAIWRYATEALRHAIDSSSDWLEAVSATELALTVYTEDEGLQQKLCNDYFRALRQVERTPIESLVGIYPAQVDSRFISRPLWFRSISALAGRELRPDDDVATIRATAMLAAAKAQCAVDDTRQKLTGLNKELPSLDWNDLTLRHANLVEAVPLARSLIVDVARTGEFALQIAHEITHAYCLIGPIGWATAAYRAVTKFCDDLVYRSAGSLANLNGGKVGGLLRDIRLFAAFRSAVQESAWTPWLEGVAQYLELLADPKENEEQIISVHAAMRSLVDPFQQTDETYSEAFERMAEQFDDFLSAAIRRLSRFRHIGYVEPELFNLQDVYLTGYLLGKLCTSSASAA